MRVRGVILCLVSLVACSQGGPESPPHTAASARPERPAILLITLDTTRADHLQPYGARDAETPALQSLAETGIVFDRAFATAPTTAPTHASLLTGLYTPRHGLRNNLTHHLADEIPTIAEWLSADGYRTAAFISAIVLERRYGLDQGFEIYDDDIRSTSIDRRARMATERSAEATAARALEWLDSTEPGSPFFLWVHFYDPHLPYSPPSPWAEAFTERPYDGEIAFMDSQIGRLLDHPMVDNGGTVVFAIGDHGEGLGEHGEDDHGLLVYDSTIRIPWILRIPGGPSGIRVEEEICQVDLVPTIAELTSLEIRPGFEALEGRSILPLLESGEKLPERPLFAETEVPFFSYGWSRLRTVRHGSLKFIDAPVAELYDLEQDRGEHRNLALERGNMQRFRQEIHAWAGDSPDPGSTLTVDSDTAEQLRAIGYLAGDTARPASEGHGNPVELMVVHRELQKIGELLASGRPQEAIERVKETLELDPDNLAALRDLSRGLVQLGRLDEAAVVAAKATAAAPWSTQALMVEADVEHRRGHHHRALELIDRSLELDDRLLEARLDRCRYLAALDRSAEAIEELEKLLADHPDNNWVALRYAEIMEIATGDYAAAEARLRTVVSRNPFIIEAWQLLGTALTRAGRPSDAIAAYREAIAGGGASADLYARLALLLSEADDPGAEEALRDAIRASPATRADLHVALGETLTARGRSREAQQEFVLAAEAPAFSNGTANAKAMALMRIGRTAEAEALWMQLTRNSPDYAKAWLNLSSLSIQRRTWPAAEGFARKATELDPMSSPAWNNLGIGLEELGRVNEAETAYRRSIEVDPRDWRAAFNLGILLRKSQRYAEAAAVQEGVLSLTPRHAGAHFELGVLYAGPLGDVERAKAHLQATIGADPNHPRARQARAVLDQLP